jgi:hypothetical protein
MNIQTVSINIQKETRYLYNIIKRSGLTEGGIIYGGMVRDEILATYYKELYDTYVEENKIIDPYNEKFWNPNFHPETNKRLIIPNDIDIYFNDNEKANLFITNIKTFSDNFNAIVIVKNIPRNRSLFYAIGQNFTHKKVKIIYRLGRTIVFCGIKIELNVDIIINEQSVSKIEPPFGNGDFTSNLFIMVQNHSNNYDIRLSSNTGTKLDDLNYASKQRIQMKIIDDLVNGRTEFIRKVSDRSAEYINGMRIIKMLKSINSLKITNILFSEISCDDVKITEQDCDICQSSIKYSDDDSNIIEINTNKHYKNYMHKKCFLEFFEKEICLKRINNDTGNIECRCTRRNVFNFKDSYKFSSLYK